MFQEASVRDVADSLNISNLPDGVAQMLAADVEYRIQQVIEEAARFTRHGRRTQMTTADIDYALRTLNIEPLYGHMATHPPIFRRVPPHSSVQSAGPVYFVEDEEIDFDRVLRDEKLVVPKTATWTAHWLAVEGVQPLIPENPAAIPRDPPLAPKQQQQLLVKQALSRELQLYYNRLTTTLIPSNAHEQSNEVKKAAALASLRHDAGLQALLPYLVRWVGDGVATILRTDATPDEQPLQIYIDVLGALLSNEALFAEPYLHQILPPLLSILLHDPLPRDALRVTAASTLASLLKQHAGRYPTLAPRIVKTLLVALISPGKGAGAREGAVRGLASVGREALRKGLIDARPLPILDSELRGNPKFAQAVDDALEILHPKSQAPVPLEDLVTLNQLHEVLGPMYQEKLRGDALWARAVLEPSTVQDVIAEL